MAAPNVYRPGRVLLLLAIFVLILTVWALFPGQAHTPKLGLDLQGGTQVILAPKAINENDEITEDQLNQAVEIIRQRVNGIGVAEADVSVQGAGNDAVIVVSVPGATQDRIVELVGRTALLDFRPVDQILNPAPASADGQQAQDPGVQDQIDKLNKQLNSDGGNSDSGKAGDNAELPAQSDNQQKDNGKKTADPQPSATDSGGSGSSDTTDAADTQQGAEIVQSPNNNAKFQKQVLALDCTKTENINGGTPDDPAQWLGTCQRPPEANAKYILEPAFIKGDTIESASAQLNPQGAGWIVTLDFDSEGSSQLAEASQKLYSLPEPKNRFAIVLDGVVVSAPSFNEPILGGSAQITGNFTQQEASDLANVLKFGALPMTLEVQAVESVSPTIGADSLRYGIIAGILGLVLVAIYLLFYYRALGIVAGVSLLVAGWITYCMFVILGNTIGFTLTLAGIAGAIVAVGITADSFVVYFERLRDEIREGKSLRRAADDGWVRARRTLLAADFVSFLAAAVLYWLSVGNVRGFAFALGLTTIVDVIVAFWFTRPLVAIMCRSAWMQRGSGFTGVSPKRLGVESLAGKQRPRTRTRSRVGAGGPDEDEPSDEEPTKRKKPTLNDPYDDGAQV